MKSLRMIFQLARRVLLWLLMGYWVVFAGYTIMHLITGGPNAVVIWYRHIARAPLQWNWAMFLVGQTMILAITVVLYLFDRRARPH